MPLKFLPLYHKAFLRAILLESYTTLYSRSSDLVVRDVVQCMGAKYELASSMYRLPVLVGAWALPGPSRCDWLIVRQLQHIIELKSA
jgi:hypothetical protein